MSARRLRGLAVASLALLAARLAPAAQEIEYQPYDAALEAAKKNGQLLMFIVVAPAVDAQGRDFSKLLREEVLPSEPIAKLIQRAFVPILVDLAEVKAGRAKVPPILKLEGQIQVPVVCFYDVQGKEVGKVLGYAPPEQYYARLKPVADKVAAAVPTKDRRDLERAVKRAQEAVGREDFRGALEALKDALGGPPGEELDLASRILREIESKANARFDEGQTFDDEKKLGSAIRAYRECARKYEGTEAAGKAKARLAELSKDAGLRKSLREYRAQKLVAQAQAAIAQKHHGDAADALDLVLKDFADAEAAAAAKKLRGQLDADPEAARRIREDRVGSDARRLLKLADSFRANKMPDKAIAEYKKVVAKYPDTSFAKTAQDRIAEIAEGSKQ